jgi:hypothetical protein
MREQVVQARASQAERFASSTTRVNAKMTAESCGSFAHSMR